MQNEDFSQRDKEKAVLLALQKKGTALIRRGLEIHEMSADGSTKLLVGSKDFNNLWTDALTLLRRHES